MTVKSGTNHGTTNTPTPTTSPGAELHREQIQPDADGVGMAWPNPPPASPSALDGGDLGKSENVSHIAGKPPKKRDKASYRTDHLPKGYAAVEAGRAAKLAEDERRRASVATREGVLAILKEILLDADESGAYRTAAARLLLDTKGADAAGCPLPCCSTRPGSPAEWAAAMDKADEIAPRVVPASVQAWAEGLDARYPPKTSPATTATTTENLSTTTKETGGLKGLADAKVLSTFPPEPKKEK